VGDLLYDQFVVGLPLFSPPKNAIGVPFHIFNVALGVLVLVIGKLDDKAGFNFLGIHDRETFAIVMPFLNSPILAKSGPEIQVFARLRAFLFAAGTVREFL
jgi:hypothetical protein